MPPAFSRTPLLGLGCLAVENLDDNALNICTDGSSYSGPRVGGAGFLFIAVDENGELQVREDSPPGWKGATNNQMELQTCIEALRIATGRHPPFDLSRFEKIVIRTDSKYSPRTSATRFTNGQPTAGESRAARRCSTRRSGKSF